MTLFARIFAGLRVAGYELRNALVRAHLRLAYPGVRCHPSVRFGKGASVRAFDGGTIDLGAGTVVLDYAWLQAEGGHLRIGRDCLIGRGAVVICSEEIELGDGTLTAEHVTIRDQDHNHAGEGRLETQGSTSAPISIGQDVWLGAKVTVTKGTAIASHAVVGANAVVTRSLPERGVYAGAPARLLTKADPGERSC